MSYLMQLNTVLGTAAFLLFVVFLVKTGLLGLRIRLERQQLHAAMTGHVPGAAKLNHALKNQIGIIHLHLSRMKQLVGKGELGALEGQMTRIADSADHLLAMTSRMEWQTQQMLLSEGEHRLLPLIEHTLTHPLLADKGMTVKTRFPFDASIACDASHLRELFTNLLTNAAEAATGSGKLEIFYELDPDGGLSVTVADDGPGIPDELLPKVIQPFFTTKKDSQGNFGLGLSYCYQVMQKHGGSLRIESRQGSGTSVVLLFPAKRILSVSPLPKG